MAAYFLGLLYKKYAPNFTTSSIFFTFYSRSMKNNIFLSFLYLLLYIAFHTNNVVAQNKAIKVSVSSNFFQTDEEKDKISSIYIDSVLKYYNKVNYLKFNKTFPIDGFKHTQKLNKSYSFVSYVDIKDTLNRQNDTVLCVKERMIELDSSGFLYNSIFINNNTHTLSVNCFESAGIILTSYGYISYTKEMDFENIEPNKLQDTVQRLKRLRNFVVVFDISSKIDNKNSVLFKTIVKNSFFANKSSIYAQSIRKPQPRYGNLFFYEDKLPKNELSKITNPVVIYIILSKIDENILLFKQKIEGKYEVTYSERKVEKRINLEEFEKYPYKTISKDLESYTVIKDVLLHLLEK